MAYPLARLVDGLVRVIPGEGPEDPRCFDVLAALCVAAVDLRERGGLRCGTVGRRRSEPVHGLDEVLAEVRSADRHDVDMAYAAIVRSLLGFERWVADVAFPPEGAGALTVRDVWADLPGLEGVLRWWVRPRSLWSQVLEADERGTRRTLYGLPAGRLLRRIGFDWDRGGNFGEVGCCDAGQGDTFGAAVSRVPDRSSFLDEAPMVLLHTIGPGLWPWFHLVEAAAGHMVVDVHADRYNDPVAVERTLGDAIHWARRSDQPQFVVFPELMVDVEARGSVRTAARAGGGPLFAVFAGSAHVALNDGRRVSQALVMDGAGEPWWTHHKRGSFRCTGKSILSALGDSRLFKAQDVRVDGDADYHEAFSEGTCLRFCDTTLGRLVVLVCADLLDDRAWNRALDRLEPDFVVVVSMSDRAARFLERAKALAEGRRVSTLYVNAACEATADGQDAARPDRDVLAFANLALDDHPERPSRVCWRSGLGLQRWDPRKGWIPHEGGPVGVDGDGMWIDLEAWLSKR